MKWSRWWAALWVAWVVFFVVLELIGMLGIPGTSTLSEWLVSNFGVKVVVLCTWIAAGILTLHWIMLGKDDRQDR